MARLTGHQAVCFWRENFGLEWTYWDQILLSEWVKDSYRRNVTMIIVLKRESIWLETMLWLETMEMVQSGCPVWWLNGGAHCCAQSSWNQDCCAGDTYVDQLREGVNGSSESDVEAPTGGLSSQTSTEELSMESQTAPETPTTTTDTTDSRPAENAIAGEPNQTESRYLLRVHCPPQRYSEQNY